MNNKLIKILLLTSMLLSISILASCLNNKDAQISIVGSNNIVALNSYAPISFGDDCSGGGKISFCTSEGVENIQILESSDTSIVKIIHADDVPLTYLKSSYYVYAIKPGKVTLNFEGDFSDGTVREATAEITVKAIDNIKVWQSCNFDSSGVIRAIAGDDFEFKAKIFNGETELNGCHPMLIDSVANMTSHCDNYRHYYTIPNPSAKPINKTLASKVHRADVAKLVTLDLVNDIDKAYINPANGHLVNLGDQNKFSVSIKTEINTYKSCHKPDVYVRSITPETCLGPNNNTIWKESDYTWVYLYGQSEGVCSVQLSLDSINFFEAVDLKIFYFNTDISSYDRAGYGSPCEIEGATTCSYGLSSVAICKNKEWILNESCSDNDKICDISKSVMKHCIDGATCTYCRDLGE